MKKGNLAPRARARWIQGANYNQYAAPPVWVAPEVCSFVYIKDVLGLPVPISVTRDDMSLGLWRYQRSPSAIIWRGDWNVLDDTGEWWLRQDGAIGEWTDRRLFITINTSTGIGIIEFRNPPNVDHGDWSATTGTLVDVSELVVASPPWVPVGIAQFGWATYGQIRSAGIDSDNTEPATWNYTGPF